MSASDLRRRQTEAEKNVNRLRNCMPEKLETFCKMHLSFLLELDGSKLEEMFLEPTFTDNNNNNNNRKKATTPFSKKKGRVLLYWLFLDHDIIFCYKTTLKKFNKSLSKVLKI